MRKLKNAIIDPCGKIRCPVCGTVNGRVTGMETIKNFMVRCRSSRRNHEHFFMLNVEPKKGEAE